MAHIFELHGTARNHLYLSIILLCLGWPIIALAWWIVYFLFFWDEFKCEYLDYEEYFEDCLEMFRLTLDDIERVYRATAFLENYYKDKTYPEDLMIRESEKTSGSSDFDRKRKSTAWDSMELYNVLWALDWVIEDWAYDAEVESDEECDLHLEDIEQYYMYLNTNRKNFHAWPNKHPTVTREYLPHTLSCSSSTNSKNALATYGSRKDLASFLAYKNDFRFRYWNRVLKRNAK